MAAGNTIIDEAANISLYSINTGNNISNTVELILRILYIIRRMDKMYRIVWKR